MPSEIGAYTPISHSLAQEVGLVCAAVYGVVWRYCQMKEGICRASLDTLGLDIKVDRATVMRSVKKLCELGYLIDQTPDRRNAPHTYILGKSVAECNSSKIETVAESNTNGAITVAQSNSSAKSVAECNRKTQTVAESYLNKDSIVIESLIDRERETHTREPVSGYGSLSLSLAKVCLINLETVSRKQSKKFAEVVGTLVKVKATVEQVENFGEWWKTNWRGKNGSPPLLEQVCDLWGEFEAGYRPKKVSISAK